MVVDRFIFENNQRKLSLLFFTFISKTGVELSTTGVSSYGAADKQSGWNEKHNLRGSTSLIIKKYLQIESE